MPVIEWNEKMATGISCVDDQHKVLFALTNDIAEAVRGNAGKAELSELIQRLQDYAMVHFREEESLMDFATYPHYFRQVREHMEFSTKVIEMHRKFVDGENVELSGMLAYVTGWLMEHTVDLDRSLADHVAGKPGES